MDLMDSIHISAAGMRAQSTRLRVVSQNVANAEAIGTRDGKDPYRRQTISFKDTLDKETGLTMVTANKIAPDKSAFDRRYEPSNPQADDQGYVNYPNVNPVMEMMDMREAKRGYESNLNVIEASKSMLNQSIALLK
jgi:flagellar basal-body rod protein FlgC